VSDRLVVALDAMGGDRAPDAVVKGAAIARERFPHIQFLLFGIEAQIAPLLEKLPRLAGSATIRHTADFITGDAKPSTALRQGRQSSMRLALDAVAAGEAQYMVSAGNTGALMAMAKFALKTLPGIDRPAIAGFFPTRRGESVMLDLGANVECDAENLVQFALMGEVFARTVLGLSRPSVALLNIGSEELKGNDAVRGAAARLRAPEAPINFVGYVEGDDIGAGTADVVVTDGFTGNVALKTAEGTAKLFLEFVRASFASSALARLGYVFARPALQKLGERLDVRRYNGAVFLGLDGIAVKSHGGTDELGFASAIAVGADMCINGFLDKIRDDIARMSAVVEVPEKPQTAAL
jgi:glycerol-3-phosphate acyltransferase PlsX